MLYGGVMAAPRRSRSERKAARTVAAAVALALVLASLIGARAVYGGLGLALGPDEYNIAAWEVRNFPDKWLYGLGRLFRGDRTMAEEDANLARFLALTREIDALERAIGDEQASGAAAASRAELAALRRQRDRLENGVEATIEGRITAVAARADLKRSLLLLPALVWPPVDLEFADSPRSLATSPRDRIVLLGTTLLRPDLTLAEVEAIEAERLGEGVSAVAFGTSGIGAYPTIVSYQTDYGAAVELAAHEWLHNYLFFRPLGVRYGQSNDLRTLNETVADLVGREIAGLVLAAWPLPGQEGGAPPPPAAAEVDLGAELRRLRAEVVALLARGEVEAAEALMEAKRLDLAAKGVRIRKINQAYFAFTNLYAGAAGNPAAVSPIGPKVDELRRRSDSLAAFLAVAGDLTSVAALDRALAALP